MFIHKLLFFCCIVLLIVSGTFFYPRWQKDGSEAQISWDAGGYYWYLPAAFIYKDIKQQKFKDSILNKYAPLPPNDFQYAAKTENGNYVMKYTLGMAIMETPWFLIAHNIAQSLGYEPDGFSRPYQFMIYLGGILFAILGVIMLRKLLSYFYSPTVVTITIVLLVFGTNYLNYAGIDVGMTHTWLFTLYVLVMYYSHNFYQSGKSKYIIYLGITIGITGLIRPPEVIAIFIPLLWGLQKVSITTFKERIQNLKPYLASLIVAIAIAAGILSLQFIYWKYASGSWFVYSYGNQGFSWLRPHLKLYAFNFQCGWLIYTPLMFFAILGIIPFIKNGQNKVAILTLIALNYYIVAAWDMWDYGGRAMIQNYPILIFPLASLWQWTIRQTWSLIILAPTTLIASYANLWWTYQAHGGGLIGDVPTNKTYYFKTLFRYDLPREYQKIRDNEDTYLSTVKRPVTLYTSDSTTFKGKPSITIVDTLTFTKQILIVPERKYKWIRAYADFSIKEKDWNVWYMTQFFITIKYKGNVLKSNQIRIQRIMEANTQKNICVDTYIGDHIFDEAELHFRNDNAGRIPCKISNIHIIGFNE